MLYHVQRVVQAVYTGDYSREQGPAGYGELHVPKAWALTGYKDVYLRGMFDYTGLVGVEVKYRKSSFWGCSPRDKLFTAFKTASLAAAPVLPMAAVAA